MVDEEREEESQERPRPRVIDKRVSARKPGDAAPPAVGKPAAETPATPPPQPQPQPETPSFRGPAEATPPFRGPAEATPPEATSPPPGEGAGVWTPEREEQAQRIAEELARTPGKDLVVTFAMNFVEVASVKLEAGDLEGAQLAIDSFGGILNALGARLGDAEAPMKSVLAQLQMAYAQRAAGPP
jgi:hypothetical protein